MSHMIIKYILQPFTMAGTKIKTEHMILEIHVHIELSTSRNINKQLTVVQVVTYINCTGMQLKRKQHNYLDVGPHYFPVK